MYDVEVGGGVAEIKTSHDITLEAVTKVVEQCRGKCHTVYLTLPTYLKEEFIRAGWVVTGVISNAWGTPGEHGFLMFLTLERSGDGVVKGRK